MGFTQGLVCFYTCFFIRSTFNRRGKAIILAYSCWLSKLYPTNKNNAKEKKNGIGFFLCVYFIPFPPSKASNIYLEESYDTPCQFQFISPIPSVTCWMDINDSRSIKRILCHLCEIVLSFHLLITGKNNMHFFVLRSDLSS